MGRAGPALLLLDLVSGFSGEQLKAALEYCRDWNTNSRTCHVAQAVLQAILLRHAPRVRPRPILPQLQRACRAAIAAAEHAHAHLTAQSIWGLTVPSHAEREDSTQHCDMLHAICMKVNRVPCAGPKQ